MLRKLSRIAFVLTVIATFLSNSHLLEARVVEEGLVSYWSFDKADVKNKKVKDVWGKNDGTILGSPKHVEGRVREAFQFSGEPDTIDVPSPANGSLDFGDDTDFSDYGMD